VHLSINELGEVNARHKSECTTTQPVDTNGDFVDTPAADVSQLETKNPPAAAGFSNRGAEI
jgi:hypothetical protein